MKPAGRPAPAGRQPAAVCSYTATYSQFFKFFNGVVDAVWMCGTLDAGRQAAVNSGPGRILTGTKNTIIN